MMLQGSSGRISCSNVHASNETPSLKDACFIKRSPPKINQPDEVKSPLIYTLDSPNCFDDGQSSAIISSEMKLSVSLCITFLSPPEGLRSAFLRRGFAMHHFSVGAYEFELSLPTKPHPLPKERGGTQGPEPTRYRDSERTGLISD
jgi:hypothetical protein